MPPAINSKPTVTLTIRVPEKLRKSIQDVAKYHNLSLNTTVIKLLQVALNNIEDGLD